MPHINVSNIDESELALFLENNLDELAKVIDCPTNWLHFYIISDTTYTDNKINKGVCFVEIKWFKRSAIINEQVVSIINNGLSLLNKKEIIVYFNELKESNYYEIEIV